MASAAPRAPKRKYDEAGGGAADGTCDGGKHRCGIGGCGYSGKTKFALRVHRANKHDIDVMWHLCDVAGCPHRTKEAASLRKHKANVHEIGTVWHQCDVGECTHRTKSDVSLRAHMAAMHDIDVVWKPCTHAGCAYSAKTPAALHTHMMNTHNTGVWHKCSVDGCTHQTKTMSNLQKHKANSHDIGVVWHTCDVDGCAHRAKELGNLQVHKANIHGIGVVWNACDVAGCDFKAKQPSSLQRHKEKTHDIGAHQCAFCLGNRNSHIPFSDKNGEHHICRRCYNQATGKKSRVELEMSNYLDGLAWLKPHLVSSDQAFVSVGGCQRYRPDKFYVIDGTMVLAADGTPTLPHRIALHIECDEHEHAYDNGTYECDERRISECYDEVDCAHYVVVRWNPHSFVRATTTSAKVPRATRLAALAELLQRIVAAPPAAPLYIYYQYYSTDNERIAENIPHELCY